MFLNKYTQYRKYFRNYLRQELIVNRFLLGASIMSASLNNILITLVSLAAITASSDENFFTHVGRKQVRYETMDMSDQQFATYSQLSNVGHLREAVNKILIPRVVGSEGHRRVRNYIVKTMKDLNWSVSLDKFEDVTPNKGKLKFQNIIATYNPNAERYLVLACHYDSKYMPDFEFLGATDSAVPCAMLLNMALVMKDHLSTVRDRKLSLMFIFFDGEEAFESWGPKDSIYGARHLANKWNKENLLDRIDMLVLLDLIGAPDPKFYSCFHNTEGWYAKLAIIEDRLSRAGLMERYTSNGMAKKNPNQYFQPRSLSSTIEDDHVPFLNLGVPILHLIPIPFPSIWHTKDDNLSIVDFATTENIHRVLRVFVMEYLLSYE